MSKRERIFYYLGAFIGAASTIGILALFGYLYS